MQYAEEFMTTRTTNTTTKKAIKGILIFAMASLFPVAVLLAEVRPLDKTEVERIEIQRSQKKWKGLQTDLNKVLKKANKLSSYRALN